MAKQVRFFYNRILTLLIGLLSMPVLRLFGIGGGDAMATCAASQCIIGDVRYIACSTGLQKQVCQSCSYSVTACATANCSETEDVSIYGTDWANSGSCMAYTSECTSNQTATQTCTVPGVGTGSRTRSCVSTVVGTTTYWMWGEWNRCVYDECTYENDYLDDEEGRCYCKLSCTATHGYGELISQLRISSTCPIISSSSSS
jgi:hypothetical protein